MTGLVARTRPLDHDVDLVSWAGEDGVLWVRDGEGLAGRGEALRIEVASDPADAVAAVLDAIDADNAVRRPGCGPVAIGALPFARSEPATFIVPAAIVGRTNDGGRWLTTISAGEHPEPADLFGPADPLPAAPAEFHVAPTIDTAEWCELVVAATKRIAAGELTKVVLARELLIRADRPFVITDVLDRLRRAYPSCMLFHVDGFIGASPELLVARRGDVVRAQPMAGTTPRSGDPTTDARLAASLLASTKDRWEHQITIDMVHDTLLPWCSWLDAEAEPSVVAVANVQHLATLVEGRLSDPEPNVLELVAALHPTPAVGGEPRAEALAIIETSEPLGRGRYAGPVGWVDAAGNGEWAVGIRSAELDGAEARVWAGVGVVADSDPQAELAETQAKFQALLTAIVRP